MSKSVAVAGQLPVMGRVWHLAKWPLLENIAAFMVGMMDLLMAARLSGVAESASDAVGVGAYINWFMTLLPQAVGVGATALVARSIGKGRWAQARMATAQSFVLGVSASLIVCVVTWILAPWLGASLGLTGSSLGFVVSYLRICALSAPMAGLLLVGSSCLRASSDTRSPFWMMLLVNICNVFASLLMVWLGHGVRGIAIGTAISWCLGAMLLMWRMRYVKANRLYVRPRRLLLHRLTLWRISRVALPQLPESLGMFSANLLILWVIGKIGIAGAHGAHIVILRIESAAFLPGFAMGVAASALVGQSLGRGEPDIARQEARRCWGLAFLFMAPSGLLMVVVPEWLIGLVSPLSTLHVELGRVPLQIVGVAQLIFGVLIVMGAVLRGAGDTLFTGWASLFSQIFVRVLLVVVLSLPTGMVMPGGWQLPFGCGWGLMGVWLGMMIELWCRAVMFLARYRFGNWTLKKV